MTLSSYLLAHKKPTGAKHTHTWFAGPCGNVTLSVGEDEIPELRKQLVADVSKKTPARLCSGPSSITEKVTRGVPFRFFADLDFAPDKIQQWRDQHNIPHDEFPAELQRRLKEIIALYDLVVSELINDGINLLAGMGGASILTTRLPYKIHLHYPVVIVDTKLAKLITRTFAERFRLEHPDLFDENVVDESVYTTGLRMLYCHKGGMVRPGKEQLEKDRKTMHEAMFGLGSYCDVYYVTDRVTWIQDRVPTVEDLARTSIQVAPATPLTSFVTPRVAASLDAKPKDKGKGKGKGKAISKMVGSDGGDGVLRSFLALESSVPFADIRTDEKHVRGETVIVPTRCRKCPFAMREHNGNQQYFVLTRDRAEQRCHDQDCSDVKQFRCDAKIARVIASLLNLGDDEVAEDLEVISNERSQEDRLLAFRGVLSQPFGNKNDVAKMNLTPAQEVMTPMGYWTCTLPENRYCPVCRAVHDRPENFMQISPLGHRGIGCNLRHGAFYPDPLTTIPTATINVLFSNTFNVTVNNSTNDNEVRDFGSYDAFPKVHDDEHLNRLCHTSLEGGTGAVAEYAHARMKGQYIYQDSTWYSYEGNCWYPHVKPDELFRKTLASVYMNLRTHFTSSKQLKWLSELVGELRILNKRKQYIEELERVIYKSRERFPLDEQANLLGFQNCVFDANTGLLRSPQFDDYLSVLAPYSIPAEVDETIEREIQQFFVDIMPSDPEREFLWLMLALHLRGSNFHGIVMVWSGVGGNGKSVLKNLLSEVFGDFFDEPPATYFTSERPSPQQPSPEMVSQRLTRCVIASEPEHDKKCNSAFIKFISGNDQVKVRRLHSNDYIVFYPRFIVTILCNEIPMFDGAAGEIRGLWRRIKILKFRTEFVSEPTLPHHRRQDPDLSRKMKRWPPHLMRMLIRVYQQYLANGSQITVPPEVQRNVDEQREENNPVDMWLNENLVVTPGTKVHVHRFDKAYNQWLVDWRSEAESRKKVGKLPPGGFITRLESLGHQVSILHKNSRDARCCKAMTRTVEDVNVRDWDTLHLDTNNYNV